MRKRVYASRVQLIRQSRVLVPFALVLRKLFTIGFDRSELDRLGAPGIILYGEGVILRNTLSLVLYFELHQIEKVLELELHNSKSVLHLKFRRILTIFVLKQNVWILVHSRSPRMVGLRLTDRRHPLVAELYAMIESIRAMKGNHGAQRSLTLLCRRIVLNFGSTPISSIFEIRSLLELRKVLAELAVLDGLDFFQVHVHLALRVKLWNGDHSVQVRLSESAERVRVDLAHESGVSLR